MQSDWSIEIRGNQWAFILRTRVLARVKSFDTLQMSLRSVISLESSIGDECLVKSVLSLGHKSLKTEQQSAVMELLIGKDVFVNLPTGFGKSLIYQVLPICISMALEKESQVATGSLRRSSIRHSSLILLKRTQYVSKVISPDIIVYKQRS